MSFPLSLKNECGLGCYRLKLVPFHLALTSEKPSPLSRHRLTSFFPLPQLGQYYDYTLKTVKNGLLFIEWDAIKGNPVAFSCSGGVFREVSDYGLDAGKGYVTMPLDGRVYTIRAVYIHALPEDLNAAVAAWQAIARNINAAPAAWQEITLCRKPYSGHMWDIAPLVEDFRTEGGGHLDYLATWPDSAKILHQENEADARWAGLEDADRELLEDLSEKEKIWHASVQPPAENEPAPSGACVPILLHDAIGQIYDCRRAYALSVNGIINYCRLHAPLLAGGFIVPLALELLRAQAMDRAAERVRELERGFRLGGTRPPGDAVPPPPLPAGPVRGAERLYMERLRAYEEWKASRGGRCWAWDEKKKCESDFTYNDGAAYTGLRDEFAGFDKEFAAYRNTFFRDYFALCAALKRVTEVWYTLLHSTLAHSFRGVMADCLRVEDTFARMLEGTPSPLLTLRDLTFYHAHEFLTTFPCLPVSPDNELLWRKCQDVQQSFYDDLTTRLFRKDDDPGYLDFFCSVLGTGNHPTMAAADLMTVVLPYAMHQPVNQKNPLLLAARMRIGLDCVQAKRSWLQLANDCELLGTPSGALGGAVLAFAFLGMVALFGAGLFIYLSTRDNGVEKFLKNCLWNIHARPSNRALRELWVPCDGGVEIHPLWRKWIDRTGEHMRAFFPSRLTCRYAPDKDELVVHFEAPCGSGPECALGLTLTCLIHPIEGESPARAELTERYLIEIPRDVKGNGIYRFKARYHVVPLIMQLKKKRELPPLYRLPSPYRAKAQSSAVGEEDLSFVYAKANVALRYRFSSDIDYGKVEEVISIPNEVPRAVIKNSLKQWGL